MNHHITILMTPKQFADVVRNTSLLYLYDTDEWALFRDVFNPQHIYRVKIPSEFQWKDLPQGTTIDQFIQMFR